MSRRRIPREVREFVAERADFCCEYCFSQEGYCPDSLNVEHIIRSTAETAACFRLLHPWHE